ncbi:phage holin family protein [Nocardioides mangrovicus]|uniref:Phage holin family protein n=1 Tax=Nocardioides mangrovicus TaxID=2478913 RepID=A0A3L8NYT2_9ACTN|nr:phage holin family protein [Nocardioides mangrovicus]RLV47931.1 phage holin family protein [Nocardioides mangrovicus]
MRFVLWLLANVLAVGAAAWLFTGITLASSGENRVATLIVVGLIFGVVTAVVKPVVKFVTFPFILLTLGLLLLVINAAMLGLTSAIAGGIGLDFHVSGFWTAVAGGVVISVVLAAFEATVGRRDRD